MMSIVRRCYAKHQLSINVVIICKSISWHAKPHFPREVFFDCLAGWYLFVQLTCGITYRNVFGEKRRPKSKGDLNELSPSSVSSDMR